MGKELIALSKRGFGRWRLIGLVEVGKITLKEASVKMGVPTGRPKGSGGRCGITASGAGPWKQGASFGRQDRR